MLKFYLIRSRSLSFLFVTLFSAGCSQQHSISYLPGDEPSTEVTRVNESVIRVPDDQVIAAGADLTAETKTSYASVWQRLFALYGLPEADNAKVERELRRYLQNPKYLTIIQQRAEPYLFAIVEEIEAKNLPGELALLPVIESAFKPRAYSRSRASGLWQFIPATGRFFGLKQNWWYDGRRDVHASTQVATNYLKELNETFDGDWFLALASYNAGKGNVRKAIRKNQRKGKPTDYWSLPLPRETREYVPRLLAIAKIFAHAKKYNLTLHPIANKRVYEPVDIGSQLDLAKAAELANMEMDEFLALNPGFNRWSTAPDGPHRLLIPVSQVTNFKTSLALLSDEQRMQWHRHQVKRGEYLGIIARRYGTTVNTIRQANHLKGNTIRSGQFLLIPSSLRAIKTPKPRETNFTYTVKKGDSFWDIARRYNVSSQQIALWNNLGIKATLQPGQKLKMKPNSGQNKVILPATNPFQTIRYTVKKGDSLFIISRKYNVSLADLRKWNASTLGKHIHPGQQLDVRISQNPPST